MTWRGPSIGPSRRAISPLLSGGIGLVIYVITHNLVIKARLGGSPRWDPLHDACHVINRLVCPPSQACNYLTVCSK